jgi:Arc/MetJ-type ribon-helix-helix transcriptional regulator
MTYPFPSDLRAIVGEQMASGKYASEDELLRCALLALAQEEQDLDAVRESLAEWRAGDPGVPLDEAFDSLRRKHGLGEAK